MKKMDCRILSILNELSAKTELSQQEISEKGIDWDYLKINVKPSRLDITKKADKGTEIFSISVKDHEYTFSYSNSGILLPVYQKEKIIPIGNFSSHMIRDIIKHSKSNTAFRLELIPEQYVPSTEFIELVNFYLNTHEKGKLENIMEEYPFMDINAKVSHQGDGLIKDKKEGNIALNYKLVNPYSNLENRTEIFSINEKDSQNLFFKFENGKIISAYTTLNIPKTEEIIYQNKAHPKLIKLMKEATALHLIGSLSSKEVLNKEEAVAMFKSFYDCFKQPAGSYRPQLNQLG